MDLPQQTKEICKMHGIKPARSRGQNFLIREEVYNEIVAAADLKPDDIVLEVGPGLGFLTAKLAAKVKRVIAVELDDKLAEVLRAGLAAQGIKNVEVINEDVLKFSIFPPKADLSQRLTSLWLAQNPLAEIPPCQGGENAIPPVPFVKGEYKIVANLPYNITSIFLRKFLEAEIKPELMVLMLQKEVAERICAQAGRMSLLAVSVQFYAEPEIVQIVEKENFWPEPEVDSAIVKITPHPNPLLGKERGEKEFFRLVKFGFSAKRKMLKNNLAAGLGINQDEAENKITNAGFNPKIRAQELSVNDWLKLFGEFH